MSYYIFCYYSLLGTPDLSEAQQAVEQHDVKGQPQTLLPELIHKIKEHCPEMLASYAESPDFAKVNSASGKARYFQHTLLANKNGGSGLQIGIFNNNISIEVPFSDSALKAEEMIERVLVFIGIICKLTHYLAYDPQTDQVYNPGLSCFGGLKTYYALSNEVLQS